MSIIIIDYSDPCAAEKFSSGLKKIGFAVIANHPINQYLIHETYQVWERFFQSSKKWRYEFDPKTHDGYISMGRSETAKGYDQKDLKEFFHYFLNGRCPDQCLPMTKKLMLELMNMASTLLNWLEQYLPNHIQEKLSQPLSAMIKNSEHTLFRIIHYPPLTGMEPMGALRAAAHADINLLTLLPAATASGLQVKHSSGDWWDVPINPSWIIVNAGDMLQECTDYYYPSTTHRVLNPTGDEAKKSRLAMPLFLHPCGEVVLSKRHTAQSYRAERFAELGLK